LQINPHIKKANITSGTTATANLTLVIIQVFVTLTWTIFANWDFDTLRSETFTECSALNHAGKSLRRVDSEGFRKDLG
jgi:hypothetical protein